MAGVWGNKSLLSGDILKNNSFIYEWSRSCKDDAASPDIPTILVDDITGHIAAARVKFGAGALAPDTLTITIKDKNGVPVLAETITATGALEVLTPIPLVQGFSIEVTGNTTVSAEFTIYLLMFL